MDHVQDCKNENENNVIIIKEYIDQVQIQIKELEDKMVQCRECLSAIDEEKGNVKTYADPSVDFFSPGRFHQLKKEEEIIREENAVRAELDQYNKELQELEDKKLKLIDIIHKLSTYEGLLKTKKEQSNDCVNVTKDSSLGINVLETQEMERKRIARELHDSTVQNLTNFVHKTEFCLKLVDIDTIRVKLELQSMIESIHSTINDMRSIIYDLRPMSIDDLGLVITVDRFINQLRDNHDDIQIKFEVSNGEKYTLPVVTLTLFRVIQEACNNALKYSKASRLSILLDYGEENITLIIEDDGSGFNIDEQRKVKKSNYSGFGLSIMKERISLLSGEIKIMSHIDHGTRIEVNVPYIKTEDGDEK